MKKEVKYRQDRNEFIEIGSSAMVWPIDHPSEQVSNTTWARTSEVIRKEVDGTFETLNTIYKPA